MRAKYRPRASGSGFFLFGSDLPGSGNRIIVRYASPGPDLQPPELVIIVRFSAWGPSAASLKRTIVRGKNDGGLHNQYPLDTKFTSAVPAAWNANNCSVFGIGLGPVGANVRVGFGSGSIPNRSPVSKKSEQPSKMAENL